MKIIPQSIKVLTSVNQFEVLMRIERAGRVCYQSEDRVKVGSFEKFVKMLIERGHESVLEHESISVRIITDRGVSHELVRHRLASYSQESTRYVDYDEVTVIQPWVMGSEVPKEIFDQWERACELATIYYRTLRAEGVAPEIARSVLPTCLKTEIVMTANLREWRHILKLRTSAAAHPQIRELCGLILEEFKKLLPVVFGDINNEETATKS